MPVYLVREKSVYCRVFSRDSDDSGRFYRAQCAYKSQYHLEFEFCKFWQGVERPNFIEFIFEIRAQKIPFQQHCLIFGIVPDHIRINIDYEELNAKVSEIADKPRFSAADNQNILVLQIVNILRRQIEARAVMRRAAIVVHLRKYLDQIMPHDINCSTRPTFVNGALGWRPVV